MWTFDNPAVTFDNPAYTFDGGGPVVAEALVAGALTATLVRHNLVQFTATAATGGIGGTTYQLQRSGRGLAVWSDVAGGTTLTPEDTTVTPLTEYDYRMRYTAGEETEYSDIVEVNTTDTPPPAPPPAGLTQRRRSRAALLLGVR